MLFLTLNDQSIKKCKQKNPPDEEDFNMLFFYKKGVKNPSKSAFTQEGYKALKHFNRYSSGFAAANTERSNAAFAASAFKSVNQCQNNT